MCALFSRVDECRVICESMGHREKSSLRMWDSAEVTSLPKAQLFQSVKTVITTRRQRSKMKTSQQGLRVLSKRIPQRGSAHRPGGLPAFLCRFPGRAETRPPLSCVSEAGALWPHLTNIETKDSSKAAQIKMDQGFKTNYQNITSLRWAC